MPHDPSQQPRHTSPRYHPLWRLIRANLYDFLLLLRESWLVLAGFGLLTLIGTLYMRSYYHLRFTTSLYETLKLLTMQSGLELPESDPIGQFLFFLIPLLGLALIFQSVLNFGRLLLDKGSRREAWQVALASTYHDQIIVCGLGRLSLRIITQLLDAGYEVVVIERNWNSEFVEHAINHKVPVIMGDAREPTMLRQAGLLRASAVVASIHDDLLNIEIALTARAIRPGIRVILRIFNEDLDSNLERIFGPNTAFSASALAAPTFAVAVVNRNIDYVLPVEQQLLGMTQLTVRRDSQLSGFVHAIEEANSIRVLQHRDAQRRRISHDLMRHLNSDDQITLIGTLDAIEELCAKNQRSSKLGTLHMAHPPLRTNARNTVIICGLGKIGYRVVQQLHQLSPHPRIVVVRLGNTPPEFQQRIYQLEGVTTIVGDAREASVLQEAGLEHATAIAALTSDDLLNLQIGLAARRHHPNIHVVLRVFSQTLAEKLADMFGIHTIYSTSGLASPTLAAAAVLGDVGHAFCTNGQLFSTHQITITSGDPLEGCRVEDIRTQTDALVIQLRRDQQSLVLPALDTIITAGDQVTLLATLDSLVRIRAMPPTAPHPPEQPMTMSKNP